MIKPETKKILGDLGKNQYGAALKEFLQDELNDIGNIATAKSWEETQGRQYSVKFIKKLFSFLDGKKVESKSKIKYD